MPLDHVDDCGSARQSSFEPRAHFVVAEHNVWEPGWTYDCPQGFRWMTSAEGDAAFTGANFGPSTGAGWVTGDDTSEPLVYYDQCGWEGYRWGGKAREHFRFSDSHITGSYKSAGSPDGRRPDLDRKRRGKVDLRVNKFAGIMCIEDGAAPRRSGRAGPNPTATRATSPSSTGPCSCRRTTGSTGGSSSASSPTTTRAGAPDRKSVV